MHALPRGQSEAAMALGMRSNQTMRSILLPQAITSMLPVLISQLVVVLKDTAIGYQITFLETVRQGTKCRRGLQQLHPGADRGRAADDQRQLCVVVACHQGRGANAAVPPRPCALEGEVEQEGAPGARAV